MTKLLITKNAAALRIGITRYRLDQLVAAGVLPGPATVNRLYHWPRMLEALKAAGLGDVLRWQPETRA